MLLQNCHLSLDYVTEVLDQILETESVHDEFRLWVTTEVHKKFPISFLQVKSSKPVLKLCSDKTSFNARACARMCVCEQFMIYEIGLC